MALVILVADKPLEQTEPTGTHLQSLEDTIPLGGGRGDVWDDVHLMAYLQTSQHHPATTRSQQQRVVQRAAGYTWSRASEGSSPTGQLMHIGRDGERRIVPPPHAWFVSHLHRECGHFGQKRTLSLVADIGGTVCQSW